MNLVETPAWFNSSDTKANYSRKHKKAPRASISTLPTPSLPSPLPSTTQSNRVTNAPAPNPCPDPLPPLGDAGAVYSVGDAISYCGGGGPPYVDVETLLAESGW